MHKRLLALLLAGIMVLGTACASKEEKTPLEEEKPAEEEVAETEEPEESSENTWNYPVDPVEDLQDDMLYHIGIVEQADHPAITHAVESFRDELSTRLEGNVSFEIRCIDNDEDACAAIVTQFMAGNWDHQDRGSGFHRHTGGRHLRDRFPVCRHRKIQLGARRPCLRILLHGLHEGRLGNAQICQHLR